MYIVDGVADAGTINFNQGVGAAPRKLTFACASKFEYLEQLEEKAKNKEDLKKAIEKEWDYLGVIGKCILWPRDSPANVKGRFMPGPIGDPSRRFRTCLRATRADYCGDGVTYTKDRTLIWLLDQPDNSSSTVKHARAYNSSNPSKPYRYEANWDENGAICILKTRYDSLAPTCQKKFTVVVDSKGEGKERPDRYYCQAGSPALNVGVLMNESAQQD